METWYNVLDCFTLGKRLYRLNKDYYLKTMGDQPHQEGPTKQVSRRELPTLQSQGNYNIETRKGGSELRLEYNVVYTDVNTASAAKDLMEHDKNGDNCTFDAELGLQVTNDGVSSSANAPKASRFLSKEILEHGKNLKNTLLNRGQMLPNVQQAIDFIESVYEEADKKMSDNNYRSTSAMTMLAQAEDRKELRGVAAIVGDARIFKLGFRRPTNQVPLTNWEVEFTQVSLDQRESVKLFGNETGLTRDRRQLGKYQLLSNMATRVFSRLTGSLAPNLQNEARLTKKLSEYSNMHLLGNLPEQLGSGRIANGKRSPDIVTFPIESGDIIFTASDAIMEILDPTAITRTVIDAIKKGKNPSEALVEETIRLRSLHVSSKLSLPDKELLPYSAQNEVKRDDSTCTSTQFFIDEEPWDLADMNVNEVSIIYKVVVDEQGSSIPIIFDNARTEDSGKPYRVRAIEEEIKKLHEEVVKITETNSDPNILLAKLEEIKNIFDRSGVSRARYKDWLNQIESDLRRQSQSLDVTSAPKSGPKKGGNRGFLDF